MAYTTFNTKKNDQLLEPMFFGNNVNVARYDQQKYEIFEKLIEKQLSFFGDLKKLMFLRIESILISFQSMRSISLFRI